MSLLQEMHYKERTAEATISFLKSISSQLGIEMDEEWQDVSSIDTYALRVTIKGTKIGSNGKGISREFATASAYAEFFERFQNDILGNMSTHGKKSRHKFYSSFDEKLLSAEEVIREDNEYIKNYFFSRNMEDATLDDKISAFEKLQKVDYFQREDENYLCVPFYSVKDNRVTYLPKNVYRLSYGSNGMSAGNTLDEAIVQGISEIYERYVQNLLFIEKPCLPDIPMDYIRKFPYIYEMYEKLNQNHGYKYILKDCSMGGKYPVAALIVLEENTGKYGLKLGCHPDFGIAMERAFTEAAQGQDILVYSGRSVLDFYNANVEDAMNIYNTYKVGKGQFPYQLFGKNPTYEFVEMPDVSDKSNSEIVFDWCNDILSDGYDILIRDVSYLGFPSVHIIIPGLSEMFDANDRRYRTYNTRHFVTGLLMEPSDINQSNSKYVLGIMQYFMPSFLENGIETYYPWYEKNDLPAQDIGMGSMLLVAMCYILNKDYKHAAPCIKKIINVLKNPELGITVSKEQIDYYNAMYYYLTAMDVLKSKDQVMEYMNLIFSDKIIEKLVKTIDNEDNILINNYPSYSKYLKAEDSVFHSANAYFDAIEKLKDAQINSKIDQLNLEQIIWSK